MSSLLRKCLVLPFVLTVSLPLSARSRPNKTAEPGVQINVCVYNLAELSPDTLDQAEREAGRIFQKAGVEVVWSDYPLSETHVERNALCGPPFGATDFRLRLLPSTRPEELGLRASSMGLALPCAEGKGGCIVNVFCHRAEELGKQGDLGMSKMLGHAIAHEIGHELLGSNALPRWAYARQLGPKGAATCCQRRHALYA